MLKSKDFSEIGKGVKPFAFTQLNPIISNSPDLMYSDDWSNRYIVLAYDSVKEVLLIDSLFRLGLLLNYKGSLTRLNAFYVFASVNEFMSLSEHSENYSNEELGADEKFCTELIETMLLLFLELEKQEQHLRILTPSTIGMRDPQGKQGHGFGLLLPLPAKYLQCLLKDEYTLNIGFAAPEVINYFEGNPQNIGCQKQFRKACLFSLGLVLLSCFGQSFSPSERIYSIKNSKQFRGTFKKLRREIKVLHRGKFVPKVLKLLLEQCQKSRDLIETFAYKIHSRQFQSLRVYKGRPVADIKISTKMTISDGLRTEGPNNIPTIVIQIGSNGSPITQSDNFQSIDRGESPIDISVGSDCMGQDSKIIEEEEDMVSSFRKNYSKTAQVQQVQSYHMQEQAPKWEEEEIIKYNADELKIGMKGKTETMEQQLTSYEQRGQEPFQEEQLKRDSAIRKQFKNEAKWIMLFLMLNLFLLGLIKTIRSG